MKLFKTLPLLVCVAVEALPTALPETNALSATPLNTPVLDARKDKSVIKGIEAELDSLSLTLVSSIDQLIAALGLSAVDDDVTDLLKGLVGDVDGLLNKVDSEVASLLDSPGLGLVDTTIVDLEKALGLKPKNTIRALLKSLGLL